MNCLVKASNLLGQSGQFVASKRAVCCVKAGELLGRSW